MHDTVAQLETSINRESHINNGSSKIPTKIIESFRDQPMNKEANKSISLSINLLLSIIYIFIEY